MQGERTRAACDRAAQDALRPFKDRRTMSLKQVVDEMNAKALILPDPTPDYAPTYALDRFISEARESMGEARWQELQGEGQ